jgi:hypothetical protein
MEDMKCINAIIVSHLILWSLDALWLSWGLMNATRWEKNKINKNITFIIYLLNW